MTDELDNVKQRQLTERMIKQLLQREALPRTTKLNFEAKTNMTERLEAAINGSEKVSRKK